MVFAIKSAIYSRQLAKEQHVVETPLSTED